MQRREVVLQRIALHEAGHAVVMHLLGVEIAHVEIDPNPPAVVRPDDDDRELGLVLPRPGQHLRPRQQVMVLLGGHAATMISSGHADHAPMWERVMADGAADDLVLAMQCIRTALPSRLRGEYEDDNVRLGLLYCWAATVRLVERCWPAVAAVAEALAERHRLTGGEVSDLIENSLGGGQPEDVACSTARSACLGSRNGG